MFNEDAQDLIIKNVICPDCGRDKFNITWVEDDEINFLVECHCGEQLFEIPRRYALVKLKTKQDKEE